VLRVQTHAHCADNQSLVIGQERGEIGMLFGPRDCITSPSVLPLDQRSGITVRAAVSGNADLERALNGGGVIECRKICVRPGETAKS